MESSYLDSNDYGIKEYTVKETGYTDDKAKKVCIISLVLRYLAPVVLFLFCKFVLGFIFEITEDVSSISNLVDLAVMLMVAAYVFSWILMGKVRRRRRDYYFGRVLMLIYIGDTSLIIPLMMLQWFLLRQA